MRKFIAVLLLTASSIVLAQPTNCEQPLAAGWNLVGVSVNIPIQYFFAEPEKVVSAWRWNSEERSWSFAAPQLRGNGQAYAAAKGFAYLYSVRIHEGIWVNAAEPTTFNSCMGQDVSPPSVPQ